MGHRAGIFVIVSVMIGLLSVSVNNAYSADPPLYLLHKNGLIQELETTTFGVTTSFNIDLDGFTITRATSLAFHPTTGELFGVVQIVSPGEPTTRLLIKIDVTDGSAILVGVLTDSISEIAFDSDTVPPILYAVSGSGSPNNPSTLFTVDTTTATLTTVCSVSDAGAGQSIGFNPNNPGFLYHGTGNSGDTTLVFETLDLNNSCNPSGIAISPSNGYDELSSLTFLETEGIFLAGDTSNRLHRLALDGTVTEIGNYPSGTRVSGVTGLAVGFVNPPVPSPDTDGDGISDQIEQMLNQTDDVTITPTLDISSVELSVNQTSGDITINGSDSSGTLALIELPFGTNSSAQIDISYDTGGLGSSVVQISALDVPYPPGKTVTFKAGAVFTNKVCFVDAPSGVSLTSFIFSSCSDDIPNSVVRMTCSNGPPASSRQNVGPFPDDPMFRDYTCQRLTIDGERFFKVTGLAFSQIGEFVDTDDDGINDFSDNCDLVPNASQEDTNGDQVGDACTVTAEICGPDTIPDLENNNCIVEPTITQQISDLTNQVNTLLAQIASLPQSVIESLLVDVNELKDSEILSEKDSKKIIKDLEKGLKDIDKGNEKSCKDVSKFVKDVNKLVQKGKLSSELAQPLVDDANVLLTDCPTTFSDDDDD